MVSFQLQAPFYRQAPLTVDTRHAQKYFEDEDNNILDDSILDQSAIDSGLEMSPPMADSRRDSFAVSSTLFSPKTEDWQSVEMQSVPSNNPFLGPHGNNPFARVDSGFASQGQWGMDHSSGTCTPIQPFDGMPTEYDGNASIFQRPMSVQTPFSNPGNQVNLFATGGPSNHSIPTSPSKDWMSQDAKSQAMAKRMSSSGDNSLRSHNGMRRGDGIRKKNARFEIPADRNLNNIDYLISQSQDDGEIKELKQQKRLLRNRQAALDSRQRKKMHTERLEDEKKQYSVVITGMEEELADLTMRFEQVMREKALLSNHIDAVRMEKEELIQNHTIETGELRKKVAVLTEHIQRSEGAALNNHAGFPHGFSQMESVPMDGPWGGMDFMADFPMETGPKPDVQIVPAKKADIVLPSEPEKSPMQGGLLFMLFLVGAFVLSNRSMPSIPRVSEDVREASATLLDSIFKDAGIPQGPADVAAVARAPQPSATNWASTSATVVTSAGLGNLAPSMLGELSDSLTQPTQEQTNEQIFSMTAAQYDGVTSQDFLQNPPKRSTSQGRRNLAEALAAMRNSEKESAAEVYTRSLLWDQIPSDVVRDFAKMVAEANGPNGHSNGVTS